MTSHIIYQGALRTQMQHLASGQMVITDAPTDNHGKGEAFSPTDLVASALGACMLTVMGIKALDMNIDLEGTCIDVYKSMGVQPRRITEIKVVIRELPAISPKDKAILEHTARTCPVHHSLHPDLIQDIIFQWPQ